MLPFLKYHVSVFSFPKKSTSDMTIQSNSVRRIVKCRVKELKILSNELTYLLFLFNLKSNFVDICSFIKSNYVILFSCIEIFTCVTRSHCKICLFSKQEILSSVILSRMKYRKILYFTQRVKAVRLRLIFIMREKPSIHKTHKTTWKHGLTKFPLLWCNIRNYPSP